MVKRLPIVLSILALVIAVMSASPFGDAARSLVPLASNSDRVDQLHASKTPKAGQLYPLGKNAKFPASVLSVKQGPAGAPGAKGDTGSQGPTGAQGQQGPAGLSGYVRVMVTTGSSNADNKEAIAECPSGKRVLGGGAIIGSPVGEHQRGVFISDSNPYLDREAWIVSAAESTETGAVWGLWVYAICADVTP